MPIQYKTRKQIQHKDIQSVLDSERKKGWTLIDIEEGARHRENDLIFLKGYHEDVFGKQIADGTNNVLDIASHYPYNPERWRLLVDGTRVFPEYDSVSQYSHGGDVHELKPAAGETVVLETNELPRYVVQFEQVASFAANINQSLQSGDVMRFGPFGDQDGWFFEHNGDHEDDQCDLVIRRAGSEVKRSSEPLGLEESILSWKMYRVLYSWYNVGPADLEEFYSSGNKGIVNHVGAIALEGTDRGPESGNVPLRYEITASESTTGLQMNAGSCALVVQGSTTPRTRGKSHKFEDTITNTGVWEPVRAFQVKPERSIVNASLLSFVATNYGADADVEVAALVMPNEKVTFTGDDSVWETPTLWNTMNNALETRTDIAEVCDNNGDPVTDFTTLTNPGGYLIGRSALELLGNQLQKGISTSKPQTIKRDIPNLDYVVIVVNSNTADTITYEAEFEQDW